MALLIAPSLGAQGPAMELSLEEVVERMTASDEARTAALANYSSARRYTLRNTRFGTRAELEVEMRFHDPGAKEFRVTLEKGSRIVRDRVLKRLIKAELESARPEILASTRITPKNYTFKLHSTGDCEERRCYVLDVSPKAPSKFHFRGRIWVDAEDFAVSRIEGSPALNPSFWIKKTSFVHEYRKFDRFWLPVANRSTTEARIFGRTEVAVHYSLYRINQAEGRPKEAGGQGTVTLEGVGTSGDDWRAQPSNGGNR